ncbi:helix-turn-helix domain-containing protein [Adlercreutzia sp.]|uniref:helix-turn-helix domain-containing protein n=1 Tax=Adlercreutzia sp. TaxID=1872387 RepID=UPI003AB8712C
MANTKTKADEFAFNGRRVRSWCVDAGISYETLADGIKVPLGTLKAWLYGERGISFPQASAIADYFGKSLDDLIEHVNPQA